MYNEKKKNKMKYLILGLVVLSVTSCYEPLGAENELVVKSITRSIDYPGKLYLKFENNDRIIYTKEKFNVGDTLILKKK